jgi:type IV pilus assembly protein PilB
MSAVIDLPMPPFLMSSDEAALQNAPVVARLVDGTVLRGSLQELNGEQEQIVITVAPHGAVQTVPFSELSYMGFMRATVTLRDFTAVDESLEEVLSAGHEQSFKIIYKKGKHAGSRVLRGKACSVDVDKHGLHIYQSRDHKRIHRVFIPLTVVEKYLINPPVKKITSIQNEATVRESSQPSLSDKSNPHSSITLIESAQDLKSALEHVALDPGHGKVYVLDHEMMASEQQFQEAIDSQENTHEKRVGEILVELGVISEEQRNFALELQKKFPNKRLGEFLQQMGVLNEASLQRALGLQKQEKSKRLDEVLEERGIINDEGVQIALAKKFDIPFVRLRNFHIDSDVLAHVPYKIASERNVIPLCMHDEHLVIAASDPLNMETMDIVRFISGHSVEIAIATKADIDYAISKYYQGHAASEILDELEVISTEQDFKPSDITRDEALSKEKPIVRLVDNIITDAIFRNASDIHIRPEESNVELMYRIDGVLNHVRSFAKHLLSAVVSRIKILSGMDISERRLPQDGRFRVNFRNAIIDLRISVMPTVQGESVVIRILNTQAGLKSIDQLGFSEHDQFVFTDMLHKSYGVMLVTGPTGCGKSTTLYAALQEIRASNVNIITIEDPVEYRLSGVQQLQVHSAIGYTFARALRNILRHDPDVIMVGEIRDEETGKIAIESALTGHLVLSTLHTNDAAGAITRLMEMGVESYLVRSAVLGVLAQRLVRRNCPHCLAEEDVNPDLKRLLGVDEQEVFYAGAGCDECNHTGYKGRMAVYELLPVSDALRTIITEGVSADDVREAAVKQGMVPLTEQALSQARQKKTSFAEVYRVRLE